MAHKQVNNLIVFCAEYSQCYFFLSLLMFRVYRMGWERVDVIDHRDAYDTSDDGDDYDRL